ncbi:hypothetical protein CLV92_101278 [Kineococcus xinjiangensis]|uniref:Uncharacterized protein n=1 Tax=Kineococcus xinjiangensis TaxID=512762 RepID=A0A2S6IW43_9ACTN|nr:hypothetical protein [Kineococcus xinjiangensis]PPK98579.1 hypothetical protein CLV92_101278 [Kineococcus xinjiangensis]
MFTHVSPGSHVRQLSSEPLLRVAVAGSAVVAVLGAAAAVVLHHETPASRLLHLDLERGVPAAWSALLIIAAATAALAQRHVSVWCAAFGGLLLFLAADEVLVIHETIEHNTGVDWQILYSPLAVLGLVVGVMLARALRARNRLSFQLLLLGGACWVTSQFLEAIQWNGDVKATGYVYLMFTEEVLEMTGTILFLAAMLVLRNRATARSAVGAGRARPVATGAPLV